MNGLRKLSLLSICTGCTYSTERKADFDYLGLMKLVNYKPWNVVANARSLGKPKITQLNNGLLVEEKVSMRTTPGGLLEKTSPCRTITLSREETEILHPTKRFEFWDAEKWYDQLSKHQEYTRKLERELEREIVETILAGNKKSIEGSFGVPKHMLGDEEPLTYERILEVERGLKNYEMVRNLAAKAVEDGISAIELTREGIKTYSVKDIYRDQKDD